MGIQIRLLRADEIECRAAQIKETGLQLLLYKDARTDMNILDETFGSMNWQRHHSRDNANCIISIWDEDKKCWVSKEDTGTESNTEREKGLASDSFKRAGFNWGIGRELYSAPFIWISSNAVEIFQTQNGRFYTNDRFSVAHIAYDDNRNISELVIVNRRGSVVFDLIGNAQVAEQEKYRMQRKAEPEPPKEEPPKAEPQKKKQNFYAQSVAAKTEELSKVRCHLCGNPLTIAEVKWCESHEEKFKGNCYCRECQKLAEKGQVG